MKKLFKWISVTAVICISSWFAFDYWTTINLEKACRDWPLIYRSLNELPQLHPATDGGQSTKDLQALYEKILLGDSQVDHDIQQRLREYIDKQLEKPVATIGAIPSEVKDILLVNSKAIEQITSLLLTEDILTLPLNINISPIEPIPADYPWFRGISGLLVASALSSQLDGDMYKAWLFLEASARLNEALFLQPFLVSQMVALVESRNILFAMRKMTVPAPKWALDWPNHDFVNGMLMAYTAEAHIMLNMVTKTNLSELLAYDAEYCEYFGMEPVEVGTVTQFIYALAGRPLMRLYISGQIADAKRIIQQRSREGLCVAQPSKVDEVNADVQFWYPGKTVLPKLISTSATRSNKYWDKFFMLEIYRAGTQVILNTKTEKVEGGEKGWPRVPVLPADSCLVHSWSYQHKPDGSVIFSYDNPLPESLSGGIIKSGYLKYIGSAGE